MSAAPAPPSDSLRRLRYTEFFVTINTNHKPKTAAEEIDLKHRLARFIERDFNHQDTWRRIITVRPSFEVVQTIKVEAAGVEVGPRTGFVHAHCTVIIEHRGEARLRAQGAQAALQDLVISRLGLNGAYAQIQLGNASILNYVSKTSTEHTAGIQTAIDFEN
jgi:hypothetical protein